MQQHSPALLDLVAGSFVRSSSSKSLRTSLTSFPRNALLHLPLYLTSSSATTSPLLSSSLFVHLRHFSLEAATPSPSLSLSPLSRTVQIQSWFERILSSWLGWRMSGGRGDSILRLGFRRGGPCVGPHQHSGGCYPVTFPGREGGRVCSWEEGERKRNRSDVTSLNSFLSALPSFLPSFHCVRAFKG